MYIKRHAFYRSSSCDSRSKMSLRPYCRRLLNPCLPAACVAHQQQQQQLSAVACQPDICCCDSRRKCCRSSSVLSYADGIIINAISSRTFVLSTLKLPRRHVDAIWRDHTHVFSASICPIIVVVVLVAPARLLAPLRPVSHPPPSVRSEPV